ncbi:hypothetical protein AO501_09340 [Mycobacterium gordonae]|uniref:Transmembrane protein n=1 Tax=Mycobacterium gordonae TaxID=1778 RepID=A0A0Q2MAB8_MYCGO|nr:MULTISPECIES: hypothetical protein [Mycobacterium]KQH76783.1 hypothetical protein AO501_09340 [Mycobacterium gordonae]MDP7731607.1 hypothetical protein [Mycobacterium sp. TY813]
MGRKVAILWHALFTIGAGVLYFYFVLPRWLELMGDISSGAGMTLRIVTGALLGLAALPVVFTLLRTRKPELAVPQLALTIRTCSIVAHVLAGVLIIGTAISEHWFSLDTAGQWLFAIYGAAAAIGVLGFFAFYLSFVAELPPPPPKPIKPKKVKERRIRGKKRGKAGVAVAEDEDAEDEDTEDEDTGDTEDAEDTEETSEQEDATETVTAETEDEAAAETVEAPAPVLSEESAPDEAAAETVEAPAPASEKTVESSARLRNRRPTGKTSHRRRRTRGGVAVEE